MTGGPMEESRAQRRQRAFTDERRVGAETADELADPVALQRQQQLAEYRSRTAAQRVKTRKSLRRKDSLAAAPAAPPAPAWIPLGPAAVRRGQAEGDPVVSGRVQGLAVSTDGARVYAAAVNGGLWRSADGGRSWQPTMDSKDLDLPQFNTNTLACGAVALVDGAGQSTDRLYLGTGAAPGGNDFRGTGMWISTDGGGNWTNEPARTGPPPPPATDPLLGQAVYAIAVDPNDAEHAIAATTNGLYRRQVTGGVAGWQRETALAVGTSVSRTMTTVVAAIRAAGPLGGTNFYAVAMSGSPMTSRTSGTPVTHSAWTALGSGFPTNQVGRCSLAVSADDPPVLYALVANDSPPSPPGNAKPRGFLHGLYRLQLGDTTLNWHKVEDVPDKLFGTGDHFQGAYDQAIVVDPENHDRVYLGGSHSGGPASVYRCDITVSGADGSRTAEANAKNLGSRVHPDIHALTFRKGSATELWVGCDGGVFTTSDARGGPENFQARNTGLATMTLNSLATHPTEDAYAFGGAQDNGGLRYTGSEIWDHQLSGDGGATVIHQGDPTTLLNIYTYNSIRRPRTHGGRYSEPDASPNMPTVRPSAADKSLKDEKPLFYPPMVDCPAAPDVVAFGGERPWVSTNFGGSWTQLPFPTGLPGATAQPKVRSLAFASATRLYAGYTDGQLFRWDFTGNRWGAALSLGAPTAGVDGALPTGLAGKAITSITADPADAANSIYLTVGGFSFADRVFRVMVGPTPPTGSPTVTWVSRPAQPPGTPPPVVPAADRLLNVQHNVIVVDPADPQHLYVGADIGVWRSVDGGQAWTVFSPGLPDAPVSDLRIVGTPAAGTVRLLRAATYGRGAWEIPLGGVPQPGLELVLRANELDRRRPGRPARTDVELPTDPKVKTRLDRSPDIRLDPPNSRGEYVIDPTQPIDLVRLEDRCTAERIAVGVPATPATTRVHVVVRSRGVTPTNGVTATLLVGRMPQEGDTVPHLPASWAGDVRAGTVIDTGEWKTVGTRTVNGLHAGQPVVTTFELSSELLPPASDSDGRRFALLTVLHHATDDALPDSTTVVADLVRSERRVALRVATGASVPSANPAGPPGGTGLVVPLTTALLARHRLTDVITGLQAKVNAAVAPPSGTAAATVQPTERYVLALAQAAKSNMDGGPTAAIEATRPGQGIGSFTLLGALGFELPGYTGLLAPGGGWTADLLRRGTPDPQLSLVKVPTTELPLRIASAALSGLPATDTTTAPKIRAFSTGMLSAAAAGLMVGPQLADLLTVDTHLDWSRHSPSAGAAAVEDAVRRRFLATVRGDPAVLSSWLPPAPTVPDALWNGLATTVQGVAGSGATRPKGWAAFEAGFDVGNPVSKTRLRNAYGLLLSDLHTDSWPAIAWWALLLPFTMAVPVSLLAARELPHGKKFFQEGAEIDERAVHEVLTLGFGIGALPTFVYSMILWGLVDEHTEPFVTALIMGLARGALVGGALGTAADEQQSPVARWLGFFPPLAAADVYSLIRAAVAGSRQPGAAFVFGLQTFPAMTALTTLGTTGLLKGAKLSHTDAGFWISWGVLTAGLLFGVGIPVAVALSRGGGYSSWFRREDRSLPILSSTAAVAAPKPDALARARTFQPNHLWTLPGTASPTLADQRYPAGMRPLVRLWWEGAGDLEIKPGDNEVVLRQGPALSTIAVPAGTTVPGLVTLLTGGLAGVRAEPEGADDPAVPLFAPGLADNGDRGLVVDHPVASARFVPVGKTKKDGVLIRHVPRADLAVQAGTAPFPVVPLSTLRTDMDGTGIGDAADLAALFAIAAAPSLGQVQVADALPALPNPALTEVAQVFRRWNLDHRRLNEWQQLVAGSGQPDPAPAAGADPMIREVADAARRPHPAGSPIAAAMGWIPLWRAWLAVAADTLADTTAAVVHGSTPEVAMPGGNRKPTNAELTDGVRFLLDLGDPPP